MKRWMIAVLVVLVLLLVSGILFLMVKKLHKDSDTSPAMEVFPLPVFESKIQVNSKEDAKSMLTANAQQIFENTKTCQIQSSNENFNYSGYWATRDLLFDYSNIEETETGARYFIVEVPIVLKDYEYHYDGKEVGITYTSCKDPSETRAMVNGEESECRSGTKEYSKKADKLKYYVLPNGNVYGRYFLPGCDPMYEQSNCSGCNVTNISYDSFAKYLTGGRMNVWAGHNYDAGGNEVIVPECENEDFLSYMENNASFIVEVELDKIVKSDSGHLGSGGPVQQSYLIAKKWIKGDSPARTIVLIMTFEEDKIPDLEKNRDYTLYISNGALVCGVKSIISK